MTVYEVAMGFVRVADETMCRPIRNLTVAKGHDTRNHILACFGGAGGQHACSIARSLGMKQVYVHKYAGILSAYGIALADVVHEEQAPCALEYVSQNVDEFNKRLEDLKVKATEKLMEQGFKREEIEAQTFLHMRYRGTDCALMCTVDADDHPNDLLYGRVFVERYKKEFGFLLQNRAIVVDDVRVRAVGKSRFEEVNASGDDGEISQPQEREITEIFFNDRHYPSKVYVMEDLRAGHELPGPCIIMDKLSTIVVEPDCTCTVTPGGDLKIKVAVSTVAKSVSTELDMIQLSIFSHRFMSIAGESLTMMTKTPFVRAFSQKKMVTYNNYHLSLKNKWVAFYNAPQFPPTSRRDWISRVRCLVRTAG